VPSTLMIHSQVPWTPWIPKNLQIFAHQIFELWKGVSGLDIYFTRQHLLHDLYQIRFPAEYIRNWSIFHHASELMLEKRKKSSSAVISIVLFFYTNFILGWFFQFGEKKLVWFVFQERMSVVRRRFSFWI